MQPRKVTDNYLSHNIYIAIFIRLHNGTQWFRSVVHEDISKLIESKHSKV